LDAALSSLAARLPEIRGLGLRRVLPSGHEFESAAEVFIEVEGPGNTRARLVAEVAGEPVAFELLARAGALRGFRRESPLARPLDPAEAGTGDPPPMALRDVRVEDVFALAHELANGKQHWLGRLERENARALWVARLPLADPARPRDGVRDPTRAVEAVLSVDAEQLDLRSVRIFDADERLLRIYDGFAHDARGIRGRARSLAAQSHTDFWADLAQPASAR
jgi:hypothetical protein